MGKSFVASVFAGVVCWAVAGADGIWNWAGAAEPDGRSVTAWAATGRAARRRPARRP
ncbi:MAG: hypothetical protein Q4D70_09355 [bacterium]|nr:hypothetical protein [bacterium]